MQPILADRRLNSPFGSLKVHLTRQIRVAIFNFPPIVQFNTTHPYIRKNYRLF